METNQTQTTETQESAQVTQPAKGRTVRAAQPAKAKLAFSMLQGFRPMSGAALYAHTAAVIDLLNMRKGAKIPRATLTKILGETAVKHHLTKTGMFDIDERGVYLSALGMVNPHWVSTDPELTAACVKVLTTGQPDGQIVKNPIGIKALA